MSEKIQPSILPGFMELLPKDQVIFNDILSKFIRVYEENGCIPMDTPIIEKEEVLLAKSGGETEKQVYKFLKGDRKLALRFDLTVPLSRYVAEHMNDLTFPFKRYQVGKVYRGERNQRGRYREFYQCDVDIIGNGKLSVKNDALVISMVSKAFKSIGLTGYKILISNRKILSGLLESLGIINKTEVMGIIDKYDKVGKEACLSMLSEQIGKENSEIINKLIEIKGTNKKVISSLKNMNANINSETFENGIKELEEVVDYLSILGLEEYEYIIDFKIIRGLDYYTGTVFETVLENYEEYGSICAGGRYDNLAQKYTDTVLPGVGAAIGITRLFFVLKEIGFLDEYESRAILDYLIISIGDNFKYCNEVCRRLQYKGMKVEVYLEEDKLKKKLAYANKLNVSYVLLIGEDEVNNREVLQKNMITGEQLKLSFEEI